MKLASFDIFDTTLIRKCGLPENIFYLLSKLVYPHNEALQNSFFLWRRRAEHNAVINLQNPYVTFEEIYTEFDPISFPGKTAKEIMALELQLEMQNLIANTSVKNLIEQKRQEGYTICFISDMYLSSDVLKHKLVEQGCAQKEDIVFVSCERKSGKWNNGELYEYVRQYFGNIPHWEHYGDNRRSDYKRAIRRGVKGILINTDYTKPENRLLQFAQYYPHHSKLAILAGFQRAARLSAPTLTADNENAADFVASLYIPYVKYILDKAQKLSIKKLYFLSRDGYILQQIAEVFQSDYPDIELKYLFVSRHSLFLPSIYTLDRKELLESLGCNSLHQEHIRVKDILQYLRISPQDLGHTASSLLNFNRIDTKEQEETLFSILESNNLKQKIVSNATQEREKLLAYFRQEGLLVHEKIATVDIGWVGTSRLAINRILEKEGFQKQTSFYCGCVPSLLSPKYGECYCFYCDELTEDVVIRLLEHYYSASPYPSTKSYEIKEDNKAYPIFKDKLPSQQPEIIQANVDMTRSIASMIKQHSYIDFHIPMRIWGGIYLKAFMGASRSINYSTFTKLGIFEDRTERLQVIQKLNIWQLFIYLMKGKIKNLMFPQQSVCYSFGKKFCKPKNSLYERQKRFFNNIGSIIAMKIIYRK